MKVFRQEFKVPAVHSEDILGYLRRTISMQLKGTPVRFVITATDRSYHCEVDVATNAPMLQPILEFNERKFEHTDAFNVVLLVPTGIGAEIGGHAGDAGSVARFLAGCCDTLITHPNAVNASDINELPENGLYVEGSVLTRLLMGTVGLQRIRANRVLVVLGEGPFVDAAINAVNAARATYGLQCPEIVLLPVRMKATYSSCGIATGEVDCDLCTVLTQRRSEYDALAISSVIEVPFNYHTDYFQGGMINPWGGVEAMLTHTLSGVLNVPTAHSPMFESSKVAEIDPGVVDPRMAAEAVSVTFLQSILKGLMRSPRVVEPCDSLTVADVSCLVIPDGCLGLPTIAALEQGIPVIAVRENKNLMRNDLSLLPWSVGQFRVVENYWEAAGVLSAMKAGIAPESVRRPFTKVVVNSSSKGVQTC